MVTEELRLELGKYGYIVNRKAVYRIMKHLGIKAIYPKPKTSVKDDTNYGVSLFTLRYRDR